MLDAFALAKAELPGLQLVLAGDPARGDLEAWRLLREVSDYAEARGRPAAPARSWAASSWALCARSRARAWRARWRTGSALTTIETLWEGTPVVSAGDAGSPEAAAERLVELVSDPGLAIELGAAGRERVREHFLITTLAESELRAGARYVASPHEGHAPRRQRARAPERRHRRRRRARDRRGPGARGARDQGRRRAARPRRAARGRRADRDRHRPQPTTRSTCSATTPRTCSPRRCSSSTRAPRSRSARRSRTASTTTSTSPTA